MDRYKLKMDAKQKLAGKWVMLIAGTLIYYFISGQGFNVNHTKEIAQHAEVRSNFGNLFQLILMGPATLGYFLFIIGIGNDKGEYGNLFDGFKRFKDTFLFNLITTIIIVIGFILFIVPGIILALTYSMGYLIMKDNPDVTATEAMQMSKTMMSGHKIDYLLFCLSFIGWFFLGILTFGLGFFYLTPYFHAAKVEYYNNLKGPSYEDVQNSFDDFDYDRY